MTVSSQFTANWKINYYACDLNLFVREEMLKKLKCKPLCVLFNLIDIRSIAAAKGRSQRFLTDYAQQR